MLRLVYGNRDDLDSFYPKGQYHIDGEAAEIDSSVLRPDVVSQIGENFYILDAKYYKYGESGDTKELPNTGSISKQIIYGKSIADKTGKSTTNIFVFPWKVDKEKTKYSGYAYLSKDTQLEVKRYHKIYLVLLDTNQLIDSFLSSQKETDIFQLVDKHV
jgi:hypothetical protein